jgi:hypothetical protein
MEGILATEEGITTRVNYSDISQVPVCERAARYGLRSGKTRRPVRQRDHHRRCTIHLLSGDQGILVGWLLRRLLSRS